MNVKIKTHEIIGKEICNIYKYLDKDEFINGCIEPDKNMSMFLIPHKKEKTLSNVINILESSLDSFNLGIACHYLSDYCCKFHNGSIFFNVLEHHLYEKNLHKISHLIKINKIKKLSQKIARNLANENYENIINKIVDKYKVKKTNIKRDLIYNYILNFVIFNIYFKRQKIKANIKETFYQNAYN
jgi:hypothetical protein